MHHQVQGVDGWEQRRKKSLKWKEVLSGEVKKNHNTVSHVARRLYTSQRSGAEHNVMTSLVKTKEVRRKNVMLQICRSEGKGL